MRKGHSGQVSRRGCEPRPLLPVVVESDGRRTRAPFSIFPLGKRRIKITCALESAGPRDEGFGQITGNVRTYEFRTKTRGRHCNTAIEKWPDERDAIIKFWSSRETLCLLAQFMRNPNVVVRSECQ